MIKTVKMSFLSLPIHHLHPHPLTLTPLPSPPHPHHQQNVKILNLYLTILNHT
jgi:hypothetical protein